MCAGASLTVCSNLCFNANGVVTWSKNTTNVRAALAERIPKALAQVGPQYDHQRRLLAALKEEVISLEEGFEILGVLGLGKGAR